MYQICIVEDEREAACTLETFLNRYGEGHDAEFAFTYFTNAIDFEMTHKRFDLVFLDIQMPGINGMEAARLLRSYDEETPIIFVTNLAQYAVKGYEVNALDFIVKPVTYHNFRMRMDKAMRHIRRNAHRSISVGTREGMRVVAFADIEYVEVSKHDLSYHIYGEDEPLVVYGSLKDFEQKAEGGTFVRISNSCLVNMNQVKSIKGASLVMSGGDTLYFSRSQKKAAIATITAFLGGSI